MIPNFPKTPPRHREHIQRKQPIDGNPRPSYNQKHPKGDGGKSDQCKCGKVVLEKGHGKEGVGDRMTVNPSLGLWSHVSHKAGGVVTERQRAVDRPVLRSAWGMCASKYKVLPRVSECACPPMLASTSPSKT